MQPWIAGEVLWGAGMCCLWNSGYDVSSRKDYALEAPQCHKCIISKGAVNSEQRLMFFYRRAHRVYILNTVSSWLL